MDGPIIIDETNPVIFEQLTFLPPDTYVAVIAINDDTALGPLLAFEKAGRLLQPVPPAIYESTCFHD